MTGLDALRERLNPVPEGDCLVGLSGGADSVALTYLLLPLRDSGALRLTAAHVNHGLRGENSDGDEAFVRMLCAREGIPLRTVSPDLGGKRDENTAREARYGAFFRIMEEENIPTLILAHQRDDQAETFLMRLLRGAGVEGLSAMRRREERNGRVLLRPMLDISGSELRQALTAAMYNAHLRSLRPLLGLGFFVIVQLLFSSGATPANLAIPFDVNDPMSGHDARAVLMSTGPMPTTCPTPRSTCRIRPLRALPSTTMT